VRMIAEKISRVGLVGLLIPKIMATTRKKSWRGEVLIKGIRRSRCSLAFIEAPWLLDG
jgi:hypothetical protein